MADKGLSDLLETISDAAARERAKKAVLPRETVSFRAIVMDHASWREAAAMDGAKIGDWLSAACNAAAAKSRARYERLKRKKK